MAERADDRLVRLLGLVAFLDGRGPVPLGDLAARFGVSPQQIRADVDQLWVTGTPGYLPGDLIDFDADAVDRGVVHLTDARGLTRPLRLGTAEAIALVAALRALLDSPPVQADDARSAIVRSALDKLTAATGEAASAVDVRIGHDGDPQVLRTITNALAQGRRLRLRYVTAADVVGERDVDPVRLLTQDGRAYLLGWCHRAWGQRTFRLDRVLDATMLDEPVDATAVACVEAAAREDADVARSAAGTRRAPGAKRAPGTEQAPGTKRATKAREIADAQIVTVTFASPARWLAEQVAAEAVTDHDDGAFTVTLRVANPVWLRSILLATAPYVLGVQPPSAADDVASTARDALAAYAGIAGGTPGVATDATG
jgi:proteasome accessory factor C